MIKKLIEMYKANKILITSIGLLIVMGIYTLVFFITRKPALTEIDPPYMIESFSCDDAQILGVTRSKETVCLNKKEGIFIKRVEKPVTLFPAEKISEDTTFMLSSDFLLVTGDSYDFYQLVGNTFYLLHSKNAIVDSSVVSIRAINVLDRVLFIISQELEAKTIDSVKSLISVYELKRETNELTEIYTYSCKNILAVENVFSYNNDHYLYLSSPYPFIESYPEIVKIGEPTPIWVSKCFTSTMEYTIDSLVLDTTSCTENGENNFQIFNLDTASFESLQSRDNSNILLNKYNLYFDLEHSTINDSNTGQFKYYLSPFGEQIMQIKEKGSIITGEAEYHFTDMWITNSYMIRILWK